MPNLSKREKILLGILGALVFGLIYYMYILVPQLNKLNNIDAVLKSNKALYNSMKESQKDIDSIKKQVDELNIKAEQSLKSIPDTSKVPEIVMDLKNITESSNCVGGVISFGNKAEDKNVQIPDMKKESSNTQNNGGIHTITLNYDVEGSFENIIILLNKIENNPRKMTINRISINKKAESELLSVSLIIDAYYMKEGSPSEPISYPFMEQNLGKQNIFN